ncbi:beta-amylase 2, chloroplastic isoform X4 [Manihot esculenta]|uniref:beta-amylase 2, chloroplastic isoform X4 n=1 Tax=Manihot esculenta TaxID=3983 RepID=UPI001CC46204|nr:beta-amylase 2, chloroplastic isoform X4 [Manihot esculenta]
MAISSIRFLHCLRPCNVASSAIVSSYVSHTLSFVASMSRFHSSSSECSFCCFSGGLVSCGARSRNFARVRDRVHRTEDDPILGDSMDDIEGKKVVMSFHKCGGNVGDDVHIPLPKWVTEIGQTNPDIYFTDREGRRNTECLTWGIDKERVLKGRTAVEAYFDYMRSFRVEFDEFFEAGIISEIEVGLGPCGELRYPSYPAEHGWKYPGIGEFQCYDKYLMKSLSKAAELRGHLFWAKCPNNAGSYNSAPYETRFFCDGGDYDSYYGRFFLNWYSRVLIDHGDRVLALANLAFEGTCISAKISGIHWWYKTASHAAELTAGFYNPSNRDGYAPIAAMLSKHGVGLNFTCVEMRTLDQNEDFPEALADPEGLVWQVLNAAWDACIPVASENALPCYDREGYNKILENAKPRHDPDGRHLSVFTYLRLSPALMERHNFIEFERFVKRMHGEAVK